MKRKYFLLISAIIFCEFFIVWPSLSAPKPQVVNAVFTTAIKALAPIDQIILLGNDTGKVFFYSEVNNLKNKNIIHRWEYNGKVVLSRKFNIKKLRQRVYSSKSLSSDQLGIWRVVISTAEGRPLKSVIFKYVDSEIDQQAIMSWPN